MDLFLGNVSWMAGGGDENNSAVRWRCGPLLLSQSQGHIPLKVLKSLLRRSSQQHMKAGSSTAIAALLVKAAEGCKFGWPLPRVNDGVWRYCLQLKAGAAELSVGSQGPGAVALLLRSVKAAHSPVHRKHYLSQLVSALTLLGRPQRTHIHKLPEVLLALGSVCVVTAQPISLPSSPAPAPAFSSRLQFL